MRPDRRKLSRIRGEHKTLDELCGYGPGESDEQPTPEAVQATLTKLEVVSTNPPPNTGNPQTQDGLVGVIPQTNEVGLHKPERAVSTNRHGKVSPNKKRMEFYLTVDKVKEIKLFCAAHDLSITAFFDWASTHLMDWVSTNPAAVVGGNTQLDDMMILAATNEDIIMLYRNLTGNRWKPADDRRARQFNEADRRLIEIGLLNTLLNAKGKKINSFAYFVPEIEEAIIARLGDETIEIMLPRRREQWNSLKAKGKRA